MRKQMYRFTAALRTTCVYVILAALTACGGHSALQKDPLDAIGSVASTAIHSTQTGAIYPIYIYLPESYANGTGTYPVIYASDGDAGFPPDGRFGNFRKILQRRRIDAILVGIGGTARRSKDYVLPGARAYHEFIIQELIPFVDSHFRTDPNRRILSGISLGGSFVVTSLFLEAPERLFFSYYISAEGSFFQPSFVALEKRFSSTIGDKSIPATLILARAAPRNEVHQPFSNDGGMKGVAAMANLSRAFSSATNSAEVDSLYRRMLDRHHPDLVLIETSFGTDHVGADNPSFEDAMARIFE